MTAAELVAKLERERLMGMPRWDVTGDSRRRRQQLEAVAVDEWLKKMGKRDKRTIRL